MDPVFTAVTAIGASPLLLILALLVRGAGGVRIVTFLPPGSNEEIARLNRRVGNVLLLLPLNCAGFGAAGLAFREIAGSLVAAMAVLFLLIVFTAVIVGHRR